MKYGPYPEYKYSQDVWLGKVPNKWRSRRLKYCVNLINEKSDDTFIDQYFVGLENIESWTGKQILTDTQSVNEGQSNLFQSGDILFNKLRPYLAKVLRPNISGICTGELLVFRPKTDLINNYLFYYLLSKDFINTVDSSTYGSKMPRANWDFIGNLQMLIPSKQEQSNIADFLDLETERIDNLILKKQLQIEILQEKRSALISHTVTKGLNPKAKMKNSEIEWLGEIPENWETNRVALICWKITNGFVGPTRDILTNSGIKYLQSLHIKGGNIMFEKSPYFVSPQWSDEHDKSILKEDDVVVVQTGDIGQCAVIPKEFEGVNCHALIILATKKQICLGSYLGLVLVSNYGYHSLKAIQTGALHPHLNCDQVREIRIPIPPIEEQKKIVLAIKNHEREIDELIKAIQISVVKLQQYHTSLVSAAVTGKIDVRQEVV